ncbi:MAG: hypothetical protein U5N85_23265 [Arcicella sp.]|nr:hypothetical protein [Arcicella sp.]
MKNILKVIIGILTILSQEITVKAQSTPNGTNVSQYVIYPFPLTQSQINQINLDQAQHSRKLAMP